LNATGDWNPRTRRLDNLLSVTRRDARANPTAFALYLDGTARSPPSWRAASGKVDRQEHPWGVPAEPLVYKPRVSGRPFGSSRISRPVMSLHDQALRTVIRMEGHADVYSSPRCGCSVRTSRSSRTLTAPEGRVAGDVGSHQGASRTTRTRRTRAPT
jgi:hypothetical protein